MNHCGRQAARYPLMLFNINQWNIIEMAKITGFSDGIHDHFLSLEGVQEALPSLSAYHNVSRGASAFGRDVTFMTGC